MRGKPARLSVADAGAGEPKTSQWGWEAEVACRLTAQIANFALQNGKNGSSCAIRMSPAAQSRDRYLVKSIVHSSQLLGAFRAPGEALSLKEISSRCSLPKTMGFRLLYTLEKCGMVDKVGHNLNQTGIRPWKQRLYRLGYAAQGTDYQFSREVTESLRQAAASEGIELICLDNRYSAKI